MTTPDLIGHAHALLDANLYLTLGTTGADGRPWTSPVCFAAAGVREFYWIAEIDAQHSRNLTERPQVSLVVFDSTVAPYHARAVYVTRWARELSRDEMEAGLAVYPGPDRRGVPTMTRDDITAPPHIASIRQPPRTYGSCVREPGRRDLAPDPGPCGRRRVTRTGDCQWTARRSAWPPSISRVLAVLPQ